MDEAEDGMPGAAGVSASANAAKRMVQAVQQFVAMLQIHLVRPQCCVPRTAAVGLDPAAHADEVAIMPDCLGSDRRRTHPGVGRRQHVCGLLQFPWPCSLNVSRT